MMHTRKMVIGLVLLGLVLPTVVGCGKVNQKNYDKITDGMTLDEVQDILGKGTLETGAAGALGDIAGSGKVMKWGDEKKSITVTFANDKVVGKTQQGL
jgi:hypothetical protein